LRERGEWSIRYSGGEGGDRSPEKLADWNLKKIHASIWGKKIPATIGIYRHTSKKFLHILFPVKSSTKFRT
jgi:hypothetical protein